MNQALAVASQLQSTPELEAQLAELLELVDYAELFPNPAFTSRVVRSFDHFVHAFDAALRGLEVSLAEALGVRVQAALLPAMLASENGERWYTKPRGYAGDFLTINKIYDDTPRGKGAIGALLDRCFLNLPAARAVQNRRGLMQRELRATISACHGRPARITSLAAGPARELFDTYAMLDDSRALESTLVDFDAGALAYCEQERTWSGLDDRIAVVEANLIRVAVGKQPLALPAQDLVYSIGLIDYFADELVVKLLDFIHGVLRPGGRVVLGNFHPCNPTKAIMDHVLEWRLIHRDEEAMQALVRASAFGTRCSRIFYEAQGINLFAEAVKA
jgi:SAM-dependent methyltransferase